jgi:hypothetical protein
MKPLRDTEFRGKVNKLVHLCFGVLKTQQPYQSNYAKII